MTRRRTVPSLVAIGVVLSAIAACGDGSGGLPDPNFLLRGATAASGSLTSAHVQMTTSGPVPGLAARTLSADIRAPKGGVGGAAVGTAEIAGLRFDFVEQGGQLYSRSADGKYAPAQPLSGVGELPEPSVMLDPDHGLAHMLADIEHPATEAREQFHGVEAFRVTGNVSRADAQAWLPGLRQDAGLTIWFATAGRHLPVGTRMTVPGASGGTVTIDFTLSDLNKKVQVPAVS
ncbi:LppX_LprAFG lipoprotein [Nocardia sp. NPDC051570]|uniref:LppX_LprAFG lipoprotein n=1 Tax=Nocardia sp. NPDC051570 TaxID=3364324 RepID=UPI0037A7FBB9